MSEAMVEFTSLSGELVQKDEKPARFKFRCVGENRNRDPRLTHARCAGLLIAEGPHSAPHGIKREPQGQNGGRPQWDWDGNHEAPTFSPSINCEGHCGWHGYIRAGRCVEPGGEESL